MEEHKGIKAFYPKTITEWRDWLAKNHQSETRVWLIQYKKKSGKPTLTYDEALYEALCYGWIDSKPNKRDEESFYQLFAKRNPKSNWSRRNKNIIQRLLDEDRMAESGLEMIRLAKATGTWDALNNVENLVIPPDLQAEFDENKTAYEFYQKFPPSTKRGILEWIFTAKRATTRAKRIKETVELAAQNIRANQYTKK